MLAYGPVEAAVRTALLSPRVLADVARRDDTRVTLANRLVDAVLVPPSMYLSLSLRAWDCVASARRGLPLGRKIYLLTYAVLAKPLAAGRIAARAGQILLNFAVRWQRQRKVAGLYPLRGVSGSTSLIHSSGSTSSPSSTSPWAQQQKNEVERRVEVSFCCARAMEKSCGLYS
jgi:hypothetical protein